MSKKVPSGSSIVDWFGSANAGAVLAIALVLNVVINGSSVLLWRLTVGRWGLRELSQRDVRLLASTTAVNAGVALPAWWLWKKGSLVIHPLGLGHGLLEALYLFVVIDLVMYCAHRLFHQGALYDWFHGWHHADDEPTSFLLFVMHPLEAFGFGAAMIVALLVWSVSLPAIALFLFLNLFFGTYAHIPIGEFGPRTAKIIPLAWVSEFHQGHHQFPMRNFGFFTPIWDVLARTKSSPTATDSSTESATSR